MDSMENENPSSAFDEIQQSVQHTIANRLLLLKLEATEKMALLSGKLIYAMIAGVLLFFTILFLSLMAAYFLSQVFNNYMIGFACVALFYLLLLLLTIWKGQGKISAAVSSTVINILLNDAQQHNNK
jgi:uncharacterized membrane protein YqjE